MFSVDLTRALAPCNQHALLLCDHLAYTLPEDATPDTPLTAAHFDLPTLTSEQDAILGLISNRILKGTDFKQLKRAVDEWNRYTRTVVDTHNRPHWRADGGPRDPH